MPLTSRQRISICLAMHEVYFLPSYLTFLGNFLTFKGTCTLLVFHMWIRPSAITNVKVIGQAHGQILRLNFQNRPIHGH